MSKRPLGDYITGLRTSKRIRLREIPEKVGISMVYFSEIESGKKIPSEEYMQKIADNLGGSMEKMKTLASQQRFLQGDSNGDIRVEVARNMITCSDEVFKKVIKLLEKEIRKTEVKI